ncbi:hypothetical protein LshimejAT787_0311500 [Lyophyllum shimeji]|uniref:Uncharacterized protein n=1 Tax=Lyophyllum shimeji TaxID=47721 RepID=A0A9P3UKP2_LYOSH|nr:hypothetical protein LshimejAT787_0311500 [Lyophyllum shimeji]
MASDYLNLADVPPFDPGKWINVGKQYPTKNIPLEVQWAQQELLKIPTEHRRHFPQPDLPALSHIVAELYEHILGRQFRVAPTKLQSQQFALLPPYAFLSVISLAKETKTGIELVLEDGERFKAMRSGEIKFKAAMKLFRKRKDEEGAVED